MEGHTQFTLSGLSEMATEEGVRLLIAHMRDIKGLPVADNLLDEDGGPDAVIKAAYLESR